MSRRTFIKGAAVTAGAIAAIGIGVPKNAMALPMPKKWDKEFDVVVLGGGIAGFSAAIEARKAGAKVVLLEKQPVTGGSSAICDGLCLLVLYSAVQKQNGINDSPDLFFKDMMAFGAERNDQALVRTYVDGSNDAFEFLKAMGVKFER
ncbi:MAG: FAD-binding protein [Desulfobacterales bacterium]|nr:FAD-binding protein [Desulfobacterales bacterium]